LNVPIDLDGKTGSAVPEKESLRATAIRNGAKMIINSRAGSLRESRSKNKNRGRFPFNL
jgi:hypothetical protein